MVSGVNGTVLNTSNADSCEKKSFFEFTSDKVTESRLTINYIFPYAEQLIFFVKIPNTPILSSS